MKIFAKRKKTTKPAEAASPRETFASDPVVLELLKKDPSEWNAKEKRMVKRYQKRMQEAQTDEDDTKMKQENDNDNLPVKGEPEPEEEETATTAVAAAKAEEGSLDLASVLEASILEALNSKQRRKLSRTLTQQGEEAIDQVIQEATEIAKGSKSASKSTKSESSSPNKKATEGGTKAAEEAESGEKSELQKVKDLLQQLNSKQKRTLSRRLEREGESCLEEVKAEAESLLKAASTTATATTEGEATTKPTESTTTTTLSGKKRKRRRGGTSDWSGLTPEERLRREEQRKMQQEAAERRANGEEDNSQFKHPLNSERRRANRRKPKWAPKRSFASEEKQEAKIQHNASGFQVRKFKNATTTA